MSYGHLNIWLRDIKCCPKNVWKVELVIKTCTGAYLVDFNPDIVDKLQKAYPKCEVKKYTWEEETTIHIQQDVTSPPAIKHLEVDLPPGCYIVRAWVCYDNLWTHPEMVIVDCGETACVNLIIPEKKGCIQAVIPPLVVAANELNIPADQLNVALGVLVETAGLLPDRMAEDMKAIADELRGAKEKTATSYAEAFEYLAKEVPRMKPRGKQR